CILAGPVADENIDKASCALGVMDFVALRFRCTHLVFVGFCRIRQRSSGREFEFRYRDGLSGLSQGNMLFPGLLINLCLDFVNTWAERFGGELPNSPVHQIKVAT